MILLLETSTLNCSVALASAEGSCVARRDESSEKHQHAERLHLLIDELLIDTHTQRTDLTAIAIGKGPGSFTGLRIGTSAAKGMCAGLGIPLLAPSPLRALQHLGESLHPEFAGRPNRIIPAVDARRMELYTFDEKGEVAAVVVDDTFRQDLGHGPALLIGDGAEKCREALGSHPSEWQFEQAFPTAADLIPEAMILWQSGQFEDVGEFEPFYFKDFVPGRPKDPLGLRNPHP